MKYISADKLIAEIEKQLASLNRRPRKMKGDYVEGLIDSFNRTIAFIKSMQQEKPEVDLEKEYKTWWNSISGKINVEHMMEWYMHETAYHFYELGLNARKEK